MNWSEEQIQSAVSILLEEGSFAKRIGNTDFIVQLLHNDERKDFTPAFLIDFHLDRRYAQSTQRVLNALKDYKIVSAGPGKNISMIKGETLYPDFLLHCKSGNQWIIGELKKASTASERMAVTQLIAYAHEVSNHLPFTPDADIHLVLISVEYSTLLRHAVAGLLLGTKYNVLCLQAGDKDGELTLNIYRPDSWTDIWQKELPPEALLTTTLNVHFKRDQPALGNIKAIMETALDLMISKAHSLDAHGFALTTMELLEDDPFDAFQITIAQFNPLVFLAHTNLKAKDSYERSILAAYLESGQTDTIYPGSLLELSRFVSDYLSTFLEVQIVPSGTWDELMKAGSTFTTHYFPQFFHSWGRIGEYHRYLFHHPSAHEYFFNAKGELENHNHPHNGIKMIEYMRGNEIFREGRFTAGDCYRLGLLLADYLLICEQLLAQRPEEITTWNVRLYYQSIRLWSAIREIEYRCNSLAERLEPMPFLLALYDLKRDIRPEVIAFCEWFQSKFLGLHVIHCTLFNLAVNSNVEDETVQSEKKIAWMATFLVDVLHQLLEEKSLYPDPKLILLLESTWLGKNLHDNTFAEWEKHISKLSKGQLLSTFEPAFVQLLDLTQPQVFHPLRDFPNMQDYHWEEDRRRLIQLNLEGEKYGVITIQTNGEISIGTINEAKRTEFSAKFGFELTPIDEPERDIYLMVKNAGIDQFGLKKWEDIMSGRAFVAYGHAS